MSRLMSDKTNKMACVPAMTQISLGICPVWSESSLCTQWVAKDLGFLPGDCKDSDQTGRMPRLIWVFAGRICHFVGFVMRRLKWPGPISMDRRIELNSLPWKPSWLGETGLRKQSSYRSDCPNVFMPLKLKNLRGHIAFGLRFCDSFRWSRFFMHAISYEPCMLGFLQFYIWIPHGKIADPYFFACPSYLPFRSYAPLKKLKWNLVSIEKYLSKRLETWSADMGMMSRLIWVF